MPDVSSTAPAQVRLWVVLDVHKHSIVAGTLPPAGGTPHVQRIENTERAIRRLIDRLGGPEGLAVAYEAGPGGLSGSARALGTAPRFAGLGDSVRAMLGRVRAGDERAEEIGCLGAAVAVDARAADRMGDDSFQTASSRRTSFPGVSRIEFGCRLAEAA